MIVLLLITEDGGVDAAEYETVEIAKSHGEDSVKTSDGYYTKYEIEEE